MAWQDNLTNEEAARLAALKAVRDESAAEYRAYRKTVKNAAEYRARLAAGAETPNPD